MIGLEIIKIFEKSTFLEDLKTLMNHVIFRVMSVFDPTCKIEGLLVSLRYGHLLL